MDNKKYFCHELSNNISIQSHNGNIIYRPCANFTEPVHEDIELNIAKAWNSTKRIEIIELVNKNKPVPECVNCYNNENQGIKSLRQASAEAYTKFLCNNTTYTEAPISINYSVGNLCNLKCIICGPNSSSTWIPDYIKLNPAADVDNFKYNKNAQLRLTDSAILKNIVNIHIHGGGEPLLSDDHTSLLKEIKKVKNLGDIRIYYNTNGTVIPSTEVLELWGECKLVELYFSIDDIGKRFNYQRTNASWEQLVENLNWFYTNMPANHMFKINCTWSYLNIYYLNELIDWHEKNFSKNRLGDSVPILFQPAAGTYKISAVSEYEYNILTNRFKNYSLLLDIIKTMEITDTSDHRAFFQSINKIDSIRGQQFELVAPEWANLLNYKNN